MDQFEIARQALEKKQISVAEQGFTAILKASPRHVPATRSLAVVRYLQKRIPQAMTLARKAIEIDPSDAESHIQLGEFLLAQRKMKEAIACYEHACDLDVGSVLAWGTLLKGYRLVGRADEIEPRMLRALEANPRSVGLMLHIGNMAGKLGEHAKALAMFDRLVATQPRHVEGHLQRANALYFLKEHEAAYAAYAQVLQLDPSRHFAHSQKGNINIALKRPQLALADFGAALRLDVACYDALIGMGAALWELNRLDESLTFIQSALQINPKGVAGYNNLAQVMAALKADAEAMAMFDKVHELEPDSKLDARLSAAVACLRMGNYEDGWRRYESRLVIDRTPVVPPERYAGAVRWNGEDLTGKSLLIVPEQGMGDTVQFCRFVPLVARATSGQVVFVVNKPLMPLFEGKDHEWGPAGNLRFVTNDAPMPPSDYVVPLMSLPYILGTRVDTIPSAPSYLSAPAVYRAKWSRALPASGKLRIGIAWAGNPNHLNDRNRSMPIAHLAPLVSDASVDWCALQPGLSVHDQTALTTVPHVFNGGAHIKDFGDTAALIEMLDVVVSVDTSVAHVAASLGKPVFLMVPWAAEWRWFHDRDDSPWYPSVRVFRQQSLGDWDSVVDAVQKALIDFARAKARAAAVTSITRLDPELIVL